MTTQNLKLFLDEVIERDTRLNVSSVTLCKFIEAITTETPLETDPCKFTDVEDLITGLPSGKLWKTYFNYSPTAKTATERLELVKQFYKELYAYAGFCEELSQKTLDYILSFVCGLIYDNKVHILRSEGYDVLGPIGSLPSAKMWFSLIDML